MSCVHLCHLLLCRHPLRRLFTVATPSCMQRLTIRFLFRIYGLNAGTFEHTFMYCIHLLRANRITEKSFIHSCAARRQMQISPTAPIDGSRIPRMKCRCHKSSMRTFSIMSYSARHLEQFIIYFVARKVYILSSFIACYFLCLLCNKTMLHPDALLSYYGYIPFYRPDRRHVVPVNACPVFCECRRHPFALCVDSIVKRPARNTFQTGESFALK